MPAGAADESPSSAAERSQGGGARFGAEDVRSGRSAADGSSAHVSGRVRTSKEHGRMIGAIDISLRGDNLRASRLFLRSRRKRMYRTVQQAAAYSIQYTVCRCLLSLECFPFSQSSH